MHTAVWKRIVHWLVGATVLALASCSPSDDADLEAVQAVSCDDGPALAGSLAFSTSADRSGPRRLEGAWLDGTVYVFLTSGPDAVRRVSFMLDGAEVRTDPHAPFDFTGGRQSTAFGWDTTAIASGPHVIAAQIKYLDGTSRTIEAAFSVGPGCGESPPSGPDAGSAPPSDPDAGAADCPVGFIGAPPDCFPTPPAPLAAGKSWSLSFHEEFLGSALDTSKLTPCFDWNYGGCTATFNGGREKYQPSQIRLANGVAAMVAEPVSPPISNGACQDGQCTFLSGLLSTARPRADTGADYLYKFTYGYVETRLRFPGTQGFFTALWMLPANPTYSYATEIDIVEILGHDPSTIWMHYHYNNRSSSYRVNGGIGNNGACAVRDYSQDWVRFGLDWQPTHIAWYIDGVKCGQFNGTASQIESGPMQLILNLMVDVQWQRNWGVGLADPTLVRQIDVDYIRVYQQH
jgi:hypothetical protein